MLLDAVIAELRARSEAVPKPGRLPTPEEVQSIETELGLSFPPDYRKFLLEASDVVLGTLEPATLDDPESHTYLPEVIASARAYGVPAELLPICEDNADFYCITPSGTVCFWSRNGVTDESWPSLADWLKKVWLDERA